MLLRYKRKTKEITRNKGMKEEGNIKLCYVICLRDQTKIFNNLNDKLTYNYADVLVVS